MYPRDSTLFTVHGVGDRRAFVCVREEEGLGEYFKDGGGLSIMSVRIQPELTGRKGEPLIKQEKAGEPLASFGPRPVALIFV